VYLSCCRYRLAFREFGSTLGVQMSPAADQAVWMPRVQVGPPALHILPAGMWDMAGWDSYNVPIATQLSL
jgi:hypothetical protein